MKEWLLEGDSEYELMQGELQPQMWVVGSLGHKSTKDDINRVNALRSFTILLDV